MTLGNANCQELDAELLYVHDLHGEYALFYHQDQGKLPPLTVESFYPYLKELYLDRVRRILKRRIPEQCYWLFHCHQELVAFELVITPVLPKSGEAKQVLIMGHRLRETPEFFANYLTVPVTPEPHHKLLVNIASKIPTSIHIETVWQQTVDALGQILQVDRCLLLAYDGVGLQIKAEYYGQSYKSITAKILIEDYQSYFQQAVISREPIIIERIFQEQGQELSVFLIATFYQNQANGLICLHQVSQRRYWTQAEIELVQELAEQLGTTIAHAKLYQELEQAKKEAEAASKLKSDFLASTTHELRTPLNGIIGFLKLVLDGMADDPEEQEEFLQQAYNSAIYLLNLINDILDIAKIEAGKMDLYFGPISLNTLLEDVEKFTRTQAENKNLTLDLKYPSTYDPVMIYGDYQRLLQVMLNLVGNAIKFTHQGGISITTEVIRKKIVFHNLSFPGMLKVSVADTGIGVPLDKQDKIFEHFVQVDSSRTKSYGGTGLGLAISKKLVEAMGGKISFYSMGEDLGSTVIFTIPLNQLPLIKSIDIN